MVNLRCTEKLLSRLGITKVRDGNVSSNILGDWYADFLNISRKQYIIFTNELTTLSVIIPAKGLLTIIPRFSQSLGILLESIEINKEKIDIELKELRNINFTRAKNRSLMQNMNELAKGAKIWFSTEPGGELSQLNMYLAGLLIGPSPYHVPKEAVCNLIQNKTEINFFQVDKIRDK